jgi:hypothetical protein
VSMHLAPVGTAPIAALPARHIDEGDRVMVLARH